MGKWKSGIAGTAMEERVFMFCFLATHTIRMIKHDVKAMPPNTVTTMMTDMPWSVCLGCVCFVKLQFFDLAFSIMPPSQMLHRETGGVARTMVVSGSETHVRPAVSAQYRHCGRNDVHALQSSKLYRAHGSAQELQRGPKYPELLRQTQTPHRE